MLLKRKWKQRINALLAAPDKAKDLAKAAGLDPATDFMHLDLRDVDFGDDDISGFNFSFCNIAGANFTTVAGIKKANFAHATGWQSAIWPRGFAPSINPPSAQRPGMTRYGQRSDEQAERPETYLKLLSYDLPSDYLNDLRVEHLGHRIISDIDANIKDNGKLLIHDHGEALRFRILGFPWLLKRTGLSIEHIFAECSGAESLARKLGWPRLHKVQNIWKSPDRQQIARALNFQLLTLPCACLIILACELALREAIISGYFVPDEQHVAKSIRNDDIVSHLSVYRHLSVSPHVWSLSNMPRDLNLKDQRVWSQIEHMFLDICPVQDREVFQDMLSGHPVSLASAVAAVAAIRIYDRGWGGTLTMRPSSSEISASEHETLGRYGVATAP